MLAVSTISTRKVLWPRARLSWAPTRVRIRSTTPIRAERAGTKLPIWARMTSSAAWRMKTLLPLILGPVRMITCSCSGSSWRSLRVEGPHRPRRAQEGRRLGRHRRPDLLEELELELVHPLLRPEHPAFVLLEL